jgi:hypothetical protein
MKKNNCLTAISRRLSALRLEITRFPETITFFTDHARLIVDLIVGTNAELQLGYRSEEFQL